MEDLKFSPCEATYDTLDGDIYNCLCYIIGKLRIGQMSLMVGAGFSKNANQQYPDWAELLLPAYCECKDEPIPDDSNNREKLIKEIKKNPSKVAQEYIDLKGRREYLDVYIEKCFEGIEDNKETQLDLHKKMLLLNWLDVITTNWDTLLEKSVSADESVSAEEAVSSSGKYILIKKAKQLKKCNRHRIIKIHGSLRSSEEKENKIYTFDDCNDYLYVITEQDFQNYHIDHQDFSNFMKVNIVQGVFCLVGFSGNDPNFRYWIKELKRTMTKGGNTQEANPIFLIDTSTTPVDEATLQYYKNNYIVRLSLYDAVKYINYNEEIEYKTKHEKIRSCFSILFEFLLLKTKIIRYF